MRILKGNQKQGNEYSPKEVQSIPLSDKRILINFRKAEKDFSLGKHRDLWIGLSWS